MTPAERTAGCRLLAAGGAVPFSIVSQEVSTGPDDAEFALRVDLQFQVDDDHEFETPPEELVEYAAFGFLFAIAVLSFADARPRENSVGEYIEKDELHPSDLLQCLQFVHGELHFHADYLRGRRIKTHPLTPQRKRDLTNLWPRESGHALAAKPSG